MAIRSLPEIFASLSATIRSTLRRTARKAHRNLATRVRQTPTNPSFVGAAYLIRYAEEQGLSFTVQCDQGVHSGGANRRNGGCYE
jgi:hypothetical protein